MPDVLVPLATAAGALLAAVVTWRRGARGHPWAAARTEPAEARRDGSPPEAGPPDGGAPDARAPVALVVGASPDGLAIGRALIGAGARVVVADADGYAATQLALALGPQAESVPVAPTSAFGALAVRGFLRAAYGGADLVVCCGSDPEDLDAPGPHSAR